MKWNRYYLFSQLTDQCEWHEAHTPNYFYFPPINALCPMMSNFPFPSTICLFGKLQNCGSLLSNKVQSSLKFQPLLHFLLTAPLPQRWRTLLTPALGPRCWAGGWEEEKGESVFFPSTAAALVLSSLLWP